MTDTTTDKGLVERALGRADSGESDHEIIRFMRQDVRALRAEIERLNRALADAAHVAAGRLKRAEAAEARLSRITAPVEGMGLETTEEERAAYDRLRLGNTNDAPADIWTHASRRWVSNYVDKLHRDHDTLTARLRVAEEALEPFAKLSERVGRSRGTIYGINEVNITFDDLRRAAAAIRSRGES